MNEINKHNELLEDDKVVFIPEETIMAIESVYGKIKQAQQELCKVAEEIKKS